MNPIENIFHITQQKVHADALSKNITFEDFDQFSKRVKETLLSVPLETINRTIESMSKRMKMITKGNGKPIRY